MYPQKLFEENKFPLPKIDDRKKIMFHNSSSQKADRKRNIYEKFVFLYQITVRNKKWDYCCEFIERDILKRI